MPDTDQITPALTAEEWSEAKQCVPRARINGLALAYAPGQVQVGDSEAIARDDCQWLVIDDLPLRSLVALANAALPDDSPHKITKADVEALDTRGNQDIYVDYPGIARLRAKLAALLPPD